MENRLNVTFTGNLKEMEFLGFVINADSQKASRWTPTSSDDQRMERSPSKELFVTALATY
jgi:hypothetical protein